MKRKCEASKKLIRANILQVTLVIVAFLTMVLASYILTSRIVSDQLTKLGTSIMDNTETKVSASLSETQFTFSNLSHTVDSMIRTGKTNEEILFFLASMNDYFTNIDSSVDDFMKTYCYMRGEYLDAKGWIPPDDYEPEQRIWYTNVVDSDTSVIHMTEPYIDADTGEMCISFSRKLEKAADSDKINVLAIDINLSRITRLVNIHNDDTKGYGILLSDKRTIVEYNNKDLIGLTFENIGENYKLIDKKLVNNEQIVAYEFTDYNGVRSIAFFRSIFNDWHIGMVIPKNSYFNEITFLAKALSLFGIILCITLSYTIIRTNKKRLISDEENKSKSEFLSRVSHEIRTPLNAIIGMVQIAKNTSNIIKKDDCLQKTEDASTHLLGIINDVLDMSKIEAGKLELSPETFTIDQLIGQIKSVIEMKIEEKEQTLEIEIDDEIPQVIYADKQRLAQVLANLLSNSNKFSPKNTPIKLVIKLISKTDSECSLYFSVTDKGIGIPAEKQQRLFSAFEQADGSTSRKYGGTGLGLAISKNLINMMHGNIEIDSTVGEGSCFFFTLKIALPLNQEDTILKKAPSFSDYTNILNGKKILIAEDNEINSMIFCELLQITGASIDLAENGLKAIEMFTSANGEYDYIFMDIQMPKMDGLTATRKIRSLDIANAKSIPIIAMTANVFKEDVDACLEAGMNAHVGKPIKLDEIIDAL